MPMDDCCDAALQISNYRNHIIYAHVAKQSDVLACGKCIRVVLRLWHAENAPASYLDEWRPLPNKPR